MFTGDKDGNIGEGEAVLSDNTELTYAADASYYLMNDILMDMSNVWNFPEGFSEVFYQLRNGLIILFIMPKQTLFIFTIAISLLYLVKRTPIRNLL